MALFVIRRKVITIFHNDYNKIAELNSFQFKNYPALKINNNVYLTREHL